MSLSEFDPDPFIFPAPPLFTGYGGKYSRKMHIGYTGNLSLCLRQFRGERSPLADFHIGGHHPRFPRFVCVTCGDLLSERFDLAKEQPTNLTNELAGRHFRLIKNL